MRDHFIELFRYDRWANERLLEAVKSNGLEDKRILELLIHVVSAQLIWLHRVEDLPTSPFPVWEIYKLGELKSMYNESNLRWNDLLKSRKINSLEEVIQYKNSKGREYESTLKEIITHLLNHGTHHRGQIMMLLRGNGITPPPNDYIVFKRLT